MLDVRALVILRLASIPAARRAARRSSPRLRVSVSPCEIST